VLQIKISAKRRSFTRATRSFLKIFLRKPNIALSHYPELEDVEIEFRYKNNIKNAFMQAQPKLANLFKGKKTVAIMFL
jgi:hypothetical protein